MKRFLIPLLASFALPTAVNAGLDKKIHEICLKASDYSGCVEAQKKYSQADTPPKSTQKDNSAKATTFIKPNCDLRIDKTKKGTELWQEIHYINACLMCNGAYEDKIKVSKHKELIGMQEEAWKKIWTGMYENEGATQSAIRITNDAKRSTKRTMDVAKLICPFNY